MVTSRRKEHWEHIYSNKSEREVSWFQTTPSASLDLIVSAETPKSAKIIDVGGGASRLAGGLLVEGYYNITVLDVAEAALAQAKRRLGSKASSVSWITADITKWRPAVAYDLWHDRAVFHFLTDQHDREAYLGVMQKALKPGAVVIIGTFSLDGPEHCSGLPVVRYSPESLSKTLGEDFLSIESMKEEHQTPGGGVQKFQFSRFAYVQS
jgi:ubiquinone/menaquinone biosynthesis C-methylase UbiE